jgi:hypothetical protein
MVLKAVPIYGSDQGDVLWLAPKTGRVRRSAFGHRPKYPVAARNQLAILYPERFNK